MRTFGGRRDRSDAVDGRWRPGRDRRAQRHPGPRGVPKAAGRSAVVVGGGIAGLAAATELAERGVAVTLLEREPQLGGRVSSWPVRVGERTTPMSRGFHAFFRQYYQLRALLRRADPTLAALRPVADYPLVAKGGPRDSFARVPRTPPFNLAGFVVGSPSFPLRALADVDLDAALGLLDVRFPQTFNAYDGVSAAEVLDRLRFPDSARHLALEVFARSFFADPHDFSGGELVAMFHTYFVGSAEGLLFDVCADDFTTALWEPLAGYLRGLGAELRTGVSADVVETSPDGVVVTAGGEAFTADAVVLATDLGPLQRLLAASPTLGDAAWRDSVAAQRRAPRFVVWRRWLSERPVPGTPDFLGTSGFGPLDNVSMVHQFEASAAHWAEQTGGSVVELHAYAVGGDVDLGALRAELAQQQDVLHPELARGECLGEQWLVRDDCGLVDTSPWRLRPGVVTPDPRVVLAGDTIRCDYPVALMERAATTGVLAARGLLSTWGVAGSDVWTAPTAPRLPGVPQLRRLVRSLQRTTAAGATAGRER
ncbi:FAD-dependent oxidoreductase [Nigerium massiliense]|uniref:FAD-dependent oxidoreductase n=1 Tax=Nigerium massiliense TaxID=1522317 RepID=UPI0006938C42|nr:FAD-dependent oxidoreductase [Nigerium massiliense]